MEGTQTSFSQAIDEHVLQVHINKFLTDSARYLEVDYAALETLPIVKVTRNN